jgi:hypothetical protein
MKEDKSFKWKSKDINVSKLSNEEIWKIFILNKISPYLTKLTKYPPFSLLWQDRRFHYKHKKTTEADDLIIKIAGEKGFWFKLFSYDEDELYINIVGKFQPLKTASSKDELYEYLRKSTENLGFYINDFEDGKVKISIIQEKPSE